MLARPDRPKALVCWSDLDALPLLDLARRRGIRVPTELAIIGYDNKPMTGSAFVDLASVDQNGRERGILAAKALLSRIAGRWEPEHLLVAPRLVLRGSLQGGPTAGTSP